MEVSALSLVLSLCQQCGQEQALPGHPGLLYLGTSTCIATVLATRDRCWGTGGWSEAAFQESSHPGACPGLLRGS